MTLTPNRPRALRRATERGASVPRALLVAAAIGAVFLLAREAGAALPAFAAWVRDLGALGPAVFVIGYAVAVVALVPASVLTLAAGAVFGLGAGVVYTFVAASLGAASAFLVSRHVARGWVEKRLAGNARFAAVDRAVAAEGRRIVFLLRLSPAFPFSFLNYALGMTNVRFGDYLVACFGMLPGTLLYVYYGKLAGDVAALAGGAAVERGAGYYVVLGLGLAATVAVTAVVTRVARRALAEATREEDGREAAVEKPDESAFVFEPSVVAPDDESNRTLLDRVRPAEWRNPEPARLYDLVVIGAGAGGLISAAVASGLGARVALIERNLMGGDCLNQGCVPSKSLLRDARRVADARRAFPSREVSGAELDEAFAAAMTRMRTVRAEIAADDSALRYRDELGVDVFLASARFTGPRSIEAGGATLRFVKAIVASGGRPSVPPVPGLAEAGFVTNETVFNLATRPRRLAVVGGGPIGCELAQAFARFGCDVVLVHLDAHLLPREDADAGAAVERALGRDGVRVLHRASIAEAVSRGSAKALKIRAGSGEETLEVEEILVAAGRRPNVEGLGLADAGIDYDARGIRIDENLRTTNPAVFAVGDCCLPWQFTHAADASAKIAVQNALFFGRKKLGDLAMPWCTYTDPEVGRIGVSVAEAETRGLEVDTFAVDLARVNRAACDGEADGFVRVLARKGSDEIVGATVVAAHAGEMLGELAVAMTAKAGLAKIAATVHPYPTWSEGLKAAANAHARTKLTPAAARALRLVIRLQRLLARR